MPAAVFFQPLSNFLLMEKQEEERLVLETTLPSNILDNILLSSPEISPRTSNYKESSNNGTALSPPQSPRSTWSFTPIQTPSPSLLYQCITSLRRDGNIFSIAVSRDLVFTGSSSARIRAWTQNDCVERGCIKTSCGEVRAILSHGDLLFTSHKDHRVRIWNIGTCLDQKFGAKRIGTLPRRRRILPFALMFPSKSSTRSNPQHKDIISCMAYYHAEGILYTGSWDKTVQAWKVNEKRCMDTFVAHGDYVNSMVVNQEDGCVFTCSSDGTIKVWRRIYNDNSHTLTMTLKFQPSPVNALALSVSPNKTCYLYSGSSDGCINFWKKETVSCRYNHGGFLQGHSFAVLCLLTLDKLILSGSEDCTIRIWKREVEGGYYHECLVVMEGHKGPVRSLATCMEMDKICMGFLVYSASLDQTFKVWKVKVLPERNSKNDNHGLKDNSKNDNVDHGKDIINEKIRSLDVEMISPVLSPSWVQKKLQHGGSM